MRTITLSLAGKDYEIKELTVGQIEDIAGLVGAYSGGAMTLNKETNRSILAVALSEDHPQVDAAALKKMRVGTVKQMGDAVSQVLAFGGFLEDKPSGEAASPLTGQPS